MTLVDGKGAGCPASWETLQVLTAMAKIFDEKKWSFFVVYYESIKRKLKIKCICECRCFERLQTKTEEFTHLTYTGLVVELEHLKIETRLIAEMSANVMELWKHLVFP